MTYELFGKILRNIKVFNDARKIGFDYLLNPDTSELHRVSDEFIKSHNIHRANLGDFIGLTNVGGIDVHRLPDGTDVPVYDLDSGQLLGEYQLRKCGHCHWM